VALERAARLASGGPGGDGAAAQAVAPLLQLLLPNLLVGLPDYPPRNLAGVAWACAKAGSLPLGSPLHSAVCSAAAPKLHECQPRDLAQRSWALAMAAGSGAGAAEAGATAAAAAEGDTPAALLGAISARSGELAGQLEPHALALLCWSLAQLHQPLPAALLAALAAAAPQLSPRQLCQAAGACAALQVEVCGRGPPLCWAERAAAAAAAAGPDTTAHRPLGRLVHGRRQR
jgi:hypothetical protein